MTATRGVDMPRLQSSSAEKFLDMPEAIYNRIARIYCNMSEERGRKELFTEFLLRHPYPTWKVLIRLLETREKRGWTRDRLSQEVKEKHLTSE